ncbi:MAG: hypothetical protein JNL21_16655 [Myxococcales bacterium]|nr:hypothetical protein [Myxococcales bacterium]
MGTSEPRVQLGQAELKPDDLVPKKLKDFLPDSALDWLDKYGKYGFETKITQSLLESGQLYTDFGMNFTPFVKATAGIGTLDGLQNYSSFGAKTNSAALDLPGGMQAKGNLFFSLYQKSGTPGRRQQARRKTQCRWNLRLRNRPRGGDGRHDSPEGFQQLGTRRTNEDYASRILGRLVQYRSQRDQRRLL